MYPSTAGGISTMAEIVSGLQLSVNSCSRMKNSAPPRLVAPLTVQALAPSISSRNRWREAGAAGGCFAAIAGLAAQSHPGRAGREVECQTVGVFAAGLALERLIEPEQTGAEGRFAGGDQATRKLVRRVAFGEHRVLDGAAVALR